MSERALELEIEQKVYVILNPRAGKGKAKRLERKIRTALGDRATMVVTIEAGGAKTLAYEAAKAGWKIVVAAGGDGTINEVVNGILRAEEEGVAKPTIGIIPVGRGNDFAWALQLPTTIEESIELIFSGRTKEIDAAISYGGNYPEGRYFINGLGIGFEPLVNFAASSFKRISGTFSYVIALIRVMINYPKAYAIEVTLDDTEFHLESQQISICNGRRMGSAFIMAPNARYDDGLLDVVYTNRPLRQRKFIPLAMHVLKGSQTNLEEFTEQRAKRARFYAPDHLMPVHVDGEEISLGCHEISIEIREKAVTIFA